jgi:hypothetical protein
MAALLAPPLMGIARAADMALDACVSSTHPTPLNEITGTSPVMTTGGETAPYSRCNIHSWLGSLSPQFQLCTGAPFSLEP